MSISRIQRETILEEVARGFFRSGERPRLIDVMKQVEAFFGQYPVGRPLPMPLDGIVEGRQSDVDQFNRILANLAFNLQVLYEANREQVEDNSLLTSTLNLELERLRARRAKLVARMDDYLFSLYNSDGYFYAFSDTFADVEFTDLSLTTAFVNTDAGQVQLPPVAGATKVLGASGFSGATIAVVEGDTEKAVTFENVTPFQFCVDGLENTVWAVEVVTNTPKELLLTVDIGMTDQPTEVSRIELNAFTVTPVQAWVHTRSAGGGGQVAGRGELEEFGSGIKTSNQYFVYTDDPRPVNSMTISMRKTEPDYEEYENGTIKYRYIFGAKSLAVSHHVYDNEAVFVSAPLQLPGALRGEQAIDVVSILTEDDIPLNTSIKYYVASDPLTSTVSSVSDLEWKPIDPIQAESVDGNTTVSFSGASTYTRDIRRTPERSTDIQLIAEDTTNEVLAERNPSAVIVPGSDIYRIAEFDVSFIPGAVTLEEGVNSTRILYDYIDTTNGLTLNYWKPRLNGTTAPLGETQGRVDAGNDFFWAGDIGQTAVSAYVETYLDSLSDQELYLRTFRKTDPQSKLWAVKVFLNGREIGSLPVGTDEMVLPWKFNQGLNHVAITANIPSATGGASGTLTLMTESALYDFGTVKLATWEYVDLYNMTYNETDDPKTFTIYNGEIVSRRRPTDNFRLTYSTPLNGGPRAVRVRADLSRTANAPSVSPSLDKYRIRFQYS